jgi:hypothetical protein
LDGGLHGSWRFCIKAIGVVKYWHRAFDAVVKVNDRVVGSLDEEEGEGMSLIILTRKRGGSLSGGMFYRRTDVTVAGGALHKGPWNGLGMDAVSINLTKIPIYTLLYYPIDKISQPAVNIKR